ncbi:gamma-glutamyl-gamma-aminobutyrate hydrolase family protein [Acidocella facilis]|uniref:gamma-glutamyl-gamma-aminobutyrate hydrolase family protein n=1 Tax=Acidocella facilis TaxID=525 RepID=UPI002E184C88|nr:gamma-glutamyl-gamma-aminobutyrate hydrolase family protein [Acidocella facilis]
MLKLGEHVPVVAVSTDHISIEGVLTNSVRQRYVDALRSTSGCNPILLPCALDANSARGIMERVDGLLLTGAPSNVHPSSFGSDWPSDEPFDLNRDRAVLHCITVAMTLKIPIFGICRGLQELNVSLAGTLSKAESLSIAKCDHTEDLGLSREEQYLPVHSVTVSADTRLARILDAAGETIFVNSLHAYCINQIGTNLSVDAKSPDGIIEAVSLKDDDHYVVGVQWHPEWYHDFDKVSQLLFLSFGDACRSYAGAKK